MFNRTESMEILKAIGSHWNWYNKTHRETWFVKTGFNKFEPKIFPDGSNLWSCVPQKIKDKYMHRMNKLDCNVPCTAVQPQLADILGHWAIVPDQPQKKETTMYKDERTEAQQAKDYLIASLEQAIYAKLEKLPVAFGLEQKMPQTIGALRQASKDGWLRLEIPEQTEDSNRIYSWFDYVKFSDPSVKEDREGFEAAKKLVRQEASDVKDIIVVHGPEKGLEALNAFKAKDFH